MLEKILDLHVHSKYSRACSPRLELPAIARACEEKGIDIVSTGDFTHPLWFEHLRDHLVEERDGIYRLKDSASRTRFIVGTEISCIYKHRDKTRRVHLLVFFSRLEFAKRFTEKLEDRGANVRADGRPIIGLSAKEALSLVMETDPLGLVIPAHAWTPWFAVFGSKSGYDTLEECFEELAPEVFSIETGLSSDPPMNHLISKLDKITLVSNSDAHSLENLGREANVFGFDNEKEITYPEIRRVLKEGDRRKFLYTIEFYPEAGMYHFDGHRDCGVVLSPDESRRDKDICPKCRKPLTVGVLHRVDDVADRTTFEAGRFIPHRYAVPLREIIAQGFGIGIGSKKVEKEYRSLLAALGSEFFILLHADIAAVEKTASDKNIALAIANVRDGKVTLKPGYDGVYGRVDLFAGSKYRSPAQSVLF